MIANTTRTIASSDHRSSNNAGLPGIALLQDPIEYATMTHHTSLDTYERIVPDDAQKDAAVVAAGVLHLANRDELVPRFSKNKMPAPEKIPEF